MSDEDDEPTLVDKWLRALKNNPLIAGVIIAGIAITAMIDFGKTVVEPMRALLPGQGDSVCGSSLVSAPSLPGDSGWIFAGYYDPNTQKWIEGPYVKVRGAKGAEPGRPIGKGDEIEVIRENGLRLDIKNFKTAGISQIADSPTTVPKGVIRDEDRTGITLAKCTKLIVKDTAMGYFPGDIPAFWLRIGV